MSEGPLVDAPGRGPPAPGPAPPTKGGLIVWVALSVALVHAGLAAYSCLREGVPSFLAYYLAGLAPPLVVLRGATLSAKDRIGALLILVLQAAFGVALMWPVPREGVWGVSGLFTLGSGLLTFLYLAYRGPAESKGGPIGRVALAVALVHAGVAVYSCLHWGELELLVLYLAGLAPPLLVLGRTTATRRDQLGALSIIVLQALVGLPAMLPAPREEGLAVAFGMLGAGLFVLVCGFLTLLYLVFRVPPEKSRPARRGRWKGGGRR